ncbi:MAG TPA: IS110 family transposase [Steroidobacteraceae bacterium]|nr:IS110 family transposase [Steroidobacteraceae bacterium]
MQVLYPRCAGLDVHKDVIVACVRCVSTPVHQEVRSFQTTTSGLQSLDEWLSSHACTHVAMEATGVYWKPVWHILEADFELVLANAAHIKNVPGRKTDVNDATWIADLLAHGLIRSSFVPPAPIQELRDLTRTRKQLVREISQHSSRIQKILEDANLKLGSVLSNVLGKSGRAILHALIAGETNPQRLADLAEGTARKKRTELIEALHGRIRDHHRGLLKVHLELVAALEQALADIDATVGKTLAPIRDSARLLTTLPGVSDLTAQVMVAEIGVDMSRFPTAAHLISWTGLCPRSDESAGKRRSSRVRKGAPWLKTALVTAAWAAVRVKDSYLQAQFHRLRSRRGAKKAILAVAASMLTAAYHMLKNGLPYRDLGADHFSSRDRSKAILRLVRRLNDLGCEVHVTPQAA